MIRIGVLTFHRAVNYGAFLQAFCLVTRLNKEKDIKAELIDYEMKTAKDSYDVDRRYSLKQKLFGDASYKLEKQRARFFLKGIRQIRDLCSSGYCCTNSTEEFFSFVKGKYDIIISGSDEVWRPKSFRPFPNPYFLPGDPGCRKLSYAASGRTDYSLMEEADRKLVRQCFADFEFVSVRDMATYTAVCNEGIDPEKMMLSCDPSFLYDFPDKTRPFSQVLGRRYRLDPGKKNLLLAGVDGSAIDSIHDYFGKEYNIVSTVLYYEGCVNASAITPFEWRELVAGADLVITSLFHGVCFSIVNDIPFIAVINEEKASKINGLLEGTKFSSCKIETDRMQDIQWDRMVKEAEACAGSRDFVLSQRKNFELFLKIIRGEENDVIS